jgi:hypothetical protein
MNVFLIIILKNIVIKKTDQFDRFLDFKISGMFYSSKVLI